MPEWANKHKRLKNELEKLCLIRSKLNELFIGEMEWIVQG